MFSRSAWMDIQTRFPSTICSVSNWKSAIGQPGHDKTEGHCYRRAFVSLVSSDIFFEVHFLIFQTFLIIFQINAWNLTNFVFCFFWRISRIVTERLRILIHTRYLQLYYFQTLEIMMEKPLSGKNEPKTACRPRVNGCCRGSARASFWSLSRAFVFFNGSIVRWIVWKSVPLNPRI